MTRVDEKSSAHPPIGGSGGSGGTVIGGVSIGGSGGSGAA